MVIKKARITKNYPGFPVLKKWEGVKRFVHAR